MSASDAPALVMLAAGMAKRYGGCKPLAPVGLHGEAVIDLNASDALAAGFGDIVLVLGPQTGPAITYHVEQVWPRAVAVHFAEQAVPLGTTHAALCARRFVGDRPFALINADDIYGVPSLQLLVVHLRTGTEHANVAYRLADTISGNDPVTRGTVEVDGDGLVSQIDERKFVTPHADGRFTAEDGRQPVELPADTPVSVNLWGFRPEIWPVLEAAVRAVHPAVDGHGDVTGTLASEEEVLLPVVVGDLVAGRAGGAAVQPVRALSGQGRCVGVTHPDDLPIVRDELSDMVGRGVRGERLWGGRP